MKNKCRDIINKINVAAIYFGVKAKNGSNP